MVGRDPQGQKENIVKSSEMISLKALKSLVLEVKSNHNNGQYYNTGVPECIKIVIMIII